MESDIKSEGTEVKEAERSPSAREIPALKIKLKLLYGKKDRERATALADKLLLSQSLDKPTLLMLAEIMLDFEDETRAQIVLHRTSERYPDEVYAQILLSRLELLKGNYREAEDMATDILKREVLSDKALTTSGISSERLALIYDVIAKAADDAGRAERAISAYERVAKLVETQEAKLTAYDNLLLSLHYRAFDGERLKSAADEYAELLESVKKFSHKKKKRHEKIRIGYISPDFRAHVVSCFSEILFRGADKKRFKVYGYHSGVSDNVTARLASFADEWRNIAELTDEKAAKLIFDDEIDILVDLAGHTKGNRLRVLAMKPAPVQISGIGFMSTTGLKTVDYFLADKYLVTDNAARDFSEELLVLPHSHFFYTPPKTPPIAQPAAFRNNGFITFASFNNFTKASDETLDAWAKILEALPEARLLLKTSAFDDKGTAQEINKRLERAGIDLDRVDTEGASADYLEAYRRVDISLDTFPYPGGGTTCDALYMSVPVITLAGKRHGSRFGYSLLENCGLSELCANTQEEYVEKAIELANDEVRLAEYHLTVRRRFMLSPVMDEVVYMNELEDAYEEIWHKYLGVKDERNLMDVAEQYYQSGDAVRTIHFALKALKSSQNKASLLYAAAKANEDLCRHSTAYRYYSEAYDYIKKNGLHESEAGGLKKSLLSQLAHLGFQLDEPLGAAELFRESAELHGDDLKGAASQYSSYLLSLHDTLLTDEEIFAAHKGYNELLKDIKPVKLSKRKHDDKLRVAYLSADFRHHVMYNFYLSLLENHDRVKFKVYCYSLSSESDEYTEKIKSLADEWRDVAGLSYSELALWLQTEEIDILVDLSGHSADNALPVTAYRPAPVIISGIGYVDTTGLYTIDGIFADEATASYENEKYLAEEPLRLTSLFCYRRDNAPPVVYREKENFLFGVIGHYHKYTDEMIDCWREILEKTPGSRLLLKNQLFYDNETVDNVYRRFKRHGFDPERLIFEPATSDYLYRLMDVDILLDTYPYPGGGTTCDALYMGVPVISRYGTRFGSRFGLSILRAVGIEQLASPTKEEYVEKAVALAADQHLVTILHQNLRGMMKRAPLMDGRGYTKEVEAAYEMMWENWLRKEEGK